MLDRVSHDGSSRRAQLKPQPSLAADATRSDARHGADARSDLAAGDWRAATWPPRPRCSIRRRRGLDQRIGRRPIAPRRPIRDDGRTAVRAVDRPGGDASSLLPCRSRSFGDGDHRGRGRRAAASARRRPEGGARLRSASPVGSSEIRCRYEAFDIRPTQRPRRTIELRRNACRTAIHRHAAIYDLRDRLGTSIRGGRSTATPTWSPANAIAGSASRSTGAGARLFVGAADQPALGSSTISSTRPSRPASVALWIGSGTERIQQRQDDQAAGLSAAIRPPRAAPAGPRSRPAPWRARASSPRRGAGPGVKRSRSVPRGTVG